MMKTIIKPMLLFTSLLRAEEPDLIYRDSFEQHIESHFLTPLPNKNTCIENGVMISKGESGRKYPPMVYMALEDKDIEIAFQYRHLGEGGFLWLFIDGDDGFGGTDHILRVKFLRHAIKIQVDGHSLDPNAKGRQMKRKADPKSGAYRLNEHFPSEKYETKTGVWQNVNLKFQGEQVVIKVNEDYETVLKRPGFKFKKEKLLFMMQGNQEGIEVDNVEIRKTEP